MRCYSKSDRIDAEVRRLLRLDWVYSRGGKHGKLASPDGKQKFTVPFSPSCHRAPLNFVKDVRRVVPLVEFA